MGKNKEVYKSHEDYLREMCEEWGEELSPRKDIFENKTYSSIREYDKEYFDKASNILDEYKIGVCGVYCITNIKNDRIYIGSSINIDLRYRMHILHLNYNKHHNLLLQHDWRNQNAKDFVLEVIWEGNQQSDRNEILFMEQLMINKHNPDYNVRKKVDYIDYKINNL